MDTAKSTIRLMPLILGMAVLCSSSPAAAYEDGDEKAGRVMLNVRGGPVFGVYNAENDLRFIGALGIDLGVAVSQNRNAYLIFTPQAQFRENIFQIIIPVGFQYDFRIVRGLYIYPRVSIGYSALIAGSSINVGSLKFSASETWHGGVAIPELGLKYVVNSRFNLGIEPLSLPVFFNSDNYMIWYRVMAFLGGNF